MPIAQEGISLLLIQAIGEILFIIAMFSTVVKIPHTAYLLKLKMILILVKQDILDLYAKHVITILLISQMEILDANCAATIGWMF